MMQRFISRSVTSRFLTSTSLNYSRLGFTDRCQYYSSSGSSTATTATNTNTNEGKVASNTVTNNNNNNNNSNNVNNDNRPIQEVFSKIKNRWPIKLEGKKMADHILASVEKESKSLKELGVIPHLVVIYVGDSPQVDSYIKKKKEACEKVGFRFTLDRFSKSIQQDQLIKRIEYHSQDSSVTGIILQLPLPPHLNAHPIIQSISPIKDVDGLNSLNMAQIFVNKKSMYIPCTPEGIVELLRQYNFKLEGKHIAVLGRSSLVGRTVATLLSQKNLANPSIQGGATVSLIHKYSKNTRPILKIADVIISATGQSGLIKKEDVKEGVVLIDVGISFVKDESKKSGYRLVGDIDPECYSKAMAYTPVPGGVGPLTVCMLLKNVLKSAQLMYRLSLIQKEQQKQQPQKQQQKPKQ